jgi:cytoskeletal protein CcmA (bactofilin family)
MSIFSNNKDKNIDTVTPPVTPPVNSTYTAPSAPQQSFSSTPTYSNNITTIAEGTVVDGHIRVEGDLRVEGNIKGTVTSKGKVIVGNGGKVDGDIICQHADISGRVAGKLKIADILFLKGNALIDGDINTGKLVMESGVKFNGNCVMGSVAKAETTTNAVSPSATTISSNNATGNVLKTNA